MSNIPDVQTAWVVVKQGKPRDVLELKTDWPVPKKLGEGEVLVKVQASALNPVGYKMMKLLPNFIAKRPHIAEFDFAGIIVDANGSNFANGDDVFGWIPMPMQRQTHLGTLAEYTRLPADHIVKRPSNVSVVGASGVPLASLTAYQALEIGKLEEGQTIFINGGSTAVGSTAIQLAKWKGAKVVAVASKKNEEYVRKLGADEFIDYTQVGPLHTYLQKNPPSAKYNLILEATGTFDPSLYTFSKPYLAPNGMFLSVGPQPRLEWKAVGQFFRLAGALFFPFFTGVKQPFKILGVENKLEDLQTLGKLMEQGIFKPVVDSVYDFPDALKAYDRLLTGRSTGKVVVKIDSSIPSN